MASTQTMTLEISLTPEGRQAISDLAAALRNASEGIEDALYAYDEAMRPAAPEALPIKCASILSERSAQVYFVTYDPNTGRSSCSCPSYRFGSGLDTEGHCKHYRKAVDTGSLY